MERREFLRRAAAGAAGLALSESGKEVVDGRLTQKVTLAFKGTALSDVCDHLRGETGVHLTAGASVADEQVTLFCEKMPLREVMRQLSRPFGYTWLRSARTGEYRYELVQDLRSQLLEEELRNRDRNAAVLALDREIERYRTHLGLSPEEARARAQTAPTADQRLLEALGTTGWGPIQMYFRLSPRDLAALRAGHWLVFSEVPAPGEQPLPSDLARCAPVRRRLPRLQGRSRLRGYGSFGAEAHELQPCEEAPARRLTSALIPPTLSDMKLVLLVKLEPAPDQSIVLLHTLEAFNDACNYAAGIAFALRCADKFLLQRKTYSTLRHRFGLSSQMAIRAISRV